MILSSQTIRKYVIFTPFYERTKAFGMTFGLGPAGYDVRIAETLKMYSGDFKLASTIEHFNMPNDILGMVCDKSTWARRGLAVQNTIIEPGWRGYLTLELTNHGSYLLNISSGMPIAQIIFMKLDQSTDKPYDGKYQNQPNKPIEAIDE